MKVAHTAFLVYVILQMSDFFIEYLVLLPFKYPILVAAVFLLFMIRHDRVRRWSIVRCHGVPVKFH
jgi:hypothetical protein